MVKLQQRQLMQEQQQMLMQEKQQQMLMQTQQHSPGLGLSDGRSHECHNQRSVVDDQN